MALTQVELETAAQPISLKARGKKRAIEEVDASPKASFKDARARGAILAFVDRVFANFKRGDRREYHELLAQFQAGEGPSTTQPSMLQAWLEGLTQSVAQIDSKHAALARAIIDLPWATFDDAFVKVYVRFVCVLVAANPEYLRTALDKAVKAFRWENGFQLGAGSNADLTKREVYARVHLLLRSLIDAVPSSPNTLLPLLERNFPPQRDRKEAQVVYYTNVLKIVEYVPHLTEGILELVVAKAIKIDVEIQVDLEDLEAYEGALDDAVFGYTAEDPFNRRIGAEDDSGASDAEGDATLPFDFDDLSSDEDAFSDDANTLDGHEERARLFDRPEAVAQLKDMASKLDAILKVIFGAFERINRAQQPLRFFAGVPSPPRLSPVGSPMDGEAQRRAVFDALLVVFDHVVLKTFKTRHTQFLLFWYSSLHPDFNDRFTASLVHTALYDDARPAVTRIAASSYLASYISRAKFVSADNTRIAVRLLCEWLEAEFHEHAPSPSASALSLPDTAAAARPSQARQLAIFYAVFQAAIYVFCYRWKDLCREADEDEDELQPVHARNWLPQLAVLKEIAFSPLNPLKYCSTNVMQQFIRIAHHVNFGYFYTIIERNQRRRLASFSSSSDDATLTPRNRSMVPAEDVKAERAEVAISSMLEEAKIETHFPFDPYKLPLTVRYITGIFKEFEAPEGLEEEDESVDEDGAVPATAEGEALPSSFSSSQTEEELSTSFDDQMSLGRR